MTIFGWALVAAFALEQVGFVLEIGKQRSPRTPGQVVVGLVLNGLFVAGILAFGTGHL